MLDLKMLIPEEISGTHIESEISQDQIRISGRYRNHRRFSLNLNRFIDEPLLFRVRSLRRRRNERRQRDALRIRKQQSNDHKEDDAIAPATRDSEIHDFPESPIKSQREEYSRLDRDAVRLLVRTHGDTQGPVQKGFDTGQGDGRSKSLRDCFHPD